MKGRRLGRPERAPRLVQQLWGLTAARGWTLTQLSTRAGVSVDCLERWRAGGRQPQLEPLLRCFGALGCDLHPMPQVEPPRREAA